MIGQQKNNVTLYCQHQDLIEKHVITLKNPYAYQNYLEIFLKNANAQILLFFSGGPDMFLMSNCA